MRAADTHVVTTYCIIGYINSKKLLRLWHALRFSGQTLNTLFKTKTISGFEVGPRWSASDVFFKLSKETVMSNQQRYELDEAANGGDSYEQKERVGRSNSSRNAPNRGRKNKSPQSFNGMHKRRRRKMQW